MWTALHLPDVVDKPGIFGEAEIISTGEGLIYGPVVYALEAQTIHGFRLMSQFTENRNKSFRQVLVEQEPHFTIRRSEWANSAKAPLTASSLRVG